MYKLLIVDDEPLIRAGLKNMIEWEVYGIELSGEAENGMQAYHTIKALQPDIALIDINMPNMNGLELIELCSHLKKCPKFIILSGYNDFEYVRTAMRFGAVNYLLKPVDQEELSNAVMATVRLLDDANTRNQQLEEGLLTLRNDFLVRILTNRIDSRELREKCRFLNLSFHCANMRVGVLKLMAKEDQYPEQRNIFSAAEFCGQLCSGTCTCYAAVDNSDNIVLIFKDNAGTLPEEEYQRLLETCTRRMKDMLPATFLTILSENIAGTSGLSEAYKSCLQTAEHREILQTLFQEESIAKPDTDTTQTFDYSGLIQCLESSDVQQLQKLLRCYFKEAVYRKPGNTLQSIKYQLIEFIIYTMQELKSSQLPSADIAIHKKKAFQIISVSGSISELEDNLFHFFTNLMEQLTENTNPAYSSMVQTALNYVRDNFQDSSLSLKTLASHMNVNAAYLGRQFALETNEYFSDYLNRIRISRASYLLETTSWKTAAIATEVGFSNISYFFTIFKKITGGRPGDYRRS